MKKDKAWFIDKWTKERNKTDVHDPMYHFINEFIIDVDQLDEPETLSQDWIERNTSPVDDEGRLYVWKRDLQNAIVPKPELPVIPAYVAEHIENYKKDNETMWTAMAGANGKVLDFLWDGRGDIKENHEIFILAYRNGYTVEEQKYYIMDKNYKLLLYQFRCGEDKHPIDVVGHYTIEEVKLQNEEAPEITLADYQFTEQEIKEYDERFWPFAVKVEELEE